MGPVDVEIIGLREITENKKKLKTSAKRVATFGFFEAGWAI